MKLNKKSYLILGIMLAVILFGTVVFLNFKKPKTSSKTTSKSGGLTFDQEGMTGDPFGDKSGPFYHKVYKAFSSDGLSYIKTGDLIADKSSVPDIVKMPDGTLFIYAVDGAQRSKSGFMIARSKDKGETWELGSLQLEASSKGGGADPQAVLLNDGRIRLYYLVNPSKKPPLDALGRPITTGEKSYIRSAVSKDGINFEEEDGNRYEMTEMMTDPDVIKIGDKWFMYLSKGSENFALSSTDGLNFKLEKSIRRDGSVSKTVDIGGGKYRQFFCRAGISSATTTDGLSFKNEGVNLKEEEGEIICDPSPVKVGESWLMIYKQALAPDKKTN